MELCDFAQKKTIPELSKPPYLTCACGQGVKPPPDWGLYQENEVQQLKRDNELLNELSARFRQRDEELGDNVGRVARGKKPKKLSPSCEKAYPAQQIAAEPDQSDNNNAYIKKGTSAWEFGFNGKQVHVEGKLKGLSLIEALLVHPNKEYTALELLQETGQREKGEGGNLKIYSKEELKTLKNAINDLRAKTQYETDIIKKEQLEQDINGSEEIINNSKNINGEPRNFSDKHRLSVSRNIKLVLNKIAVDHPELNNHLETFLKRGGICYYKPDSKIFWEIS